MLKRITALMLIFLISMTIPTFASGKTEIDISRLLEQITPTQDKNGANMMFDGDAVTYWQPTNIDDNGDFTILKFREPITFNSAIIYEDRQYVLVKGIQFERIAYPVDKFQFQYSDDGENWKLFYSGSRIGERLEIKFNDVTTKYIKFVARPEERNVRISGLRLFYQDAAVGKTEGAYYVAKNGSDDNDGSLENPFATIGKAAQVLKAGETCYIREGIYRETVKPQNSGEAGLPITYTAYPGEKVLISGADVLNTEWTVYKDGIYKAKTDVKINQLFVDTKRMTIARYPNAKADNLTERNLITRVEEGDHGFITYKNIPSGDIDGAMVHIWPGSQWIIFDKEVTRDKENPAKLIFKEPFTATTDEFNTSDYTRPKPDNPFYIYGRIGLLDIPTEWVQQGNELYLWTGEGDDPKNHSIEYKVRDWAFDIFDKRYIEIKNLNIEGASIRLSEASYCVIDGCRMKYISDNVDKALIIAGDNNTVKNSLIAYTPGSGILTHGTNVTIENNIIHDVCEYGGHSAAVHLKGQYTNITRNTMYNSGNYIIEFDGSRAYKTEITYNHMYNGNNFGDDVGMVYMWGNRGEGSRISYNWIHDSKTGRGIYLDSFTTDYKVDHNVVYDVMDALRINSGDTNCMVYNNILLAKNKSIGGDPFPGAPPTNKGTIIENNILKGIIALASLGTSNAPTMINNVETEVDLKTFFAVNSTDVVDKGNVAKGFTDNFIGKAPDIGAYEKGGEYWIPGANWKE